MTTLLILLGAVLIGGVALDVVMTTVSVGSGAGPITRFISRHVWGAARAIWPHQHRALRRAGVGVLLLSILVWLLLIWTGWTLVFTAADAAVVDSSTGQPATIEQRIYYAGYTILTLGNGDYRPDGPLWRVATVLAVANGFALITLAISYLVPVVSAVTEKRQLAAHLHALGPSPHDLVVGSWDGDAFAPLDSDLWRLSQQVVLHHQRHHTYPILHYSHAIEHTTAAPLRFAALDEALTLLLHGVASDLRPHGRGLAVLRSAITDYLDTITTIYLSPSDAPPPLPDLVPLRQAGIRTVDDETFARALDGLSHRRSQLLGLVHNDGWSWTDIAH